MKCEYCKKYIPGADNVQKNAIIFCDSICIWMKFEGEDMLKNGKFPEWDRK